MSSLKGQYLAVETVFVFGLGIMVAIGVIGIFNQFQSGVLDRAEPQHVELVSSKIETGVRSLSYADTDTAYSSGYRQIDLPQRVAGRSYSIELDGGEIVLRVEDDTYRESFSGLNSYDFSGSSGGGDVTVFKEGRQYTLRSR